MLHRRQAGEDRPILAGLLGFHGHGRRTNALTLFGLGAVMRTGVSVLDRFSGGDPLPGMLARVRSLFRSRVVTVIVRVRAPADLAARGSQRQEQYEQRRHASVPALGARVHGHRKAERIVGCPTEAYNDP